MACARIPDGPQGVLCTSDNDDGSRGAFEGNSLCSETPLSFDRSSEQRESWSGELILTSDFDGPFNFLLGGIYAKSKTPDNSRSEERRTGKEGVSTCRSRRSTDHIKQKIHTRK